MSMVIPGRGERHIRWRAILVPLLLGLGVQAGFAAQAPPVELAHRFLSSLPPEDRDLDWAALERFYRSVDDTPVWLAPRGLKPRAHLLRRRLAQAADEGLPAQDYLTGSLDALWGATDKAARLQLELRLSNAFFDYARDVRGGRLQSATAAPLWKIPPTAVDPVPLLRLAILSSDFSAALDTLPPAHVGYRRLREALARYRAIAEQGGWQAVDPGGLLRTGSRGVRVAQLRQRLALEGDLSLSSAAGRQFDQTLAFAVRRFQVRYGLQVDGLVGPATLDALNLPVERRIEQILVAMERWRWLPQTLGRRHIIVNMPAFELVAYEAGEARLAMPVIIGRRERPTPVISGQLHTVVINPDWTVPRSIALKDLLPRQRRDPGYLDSQHIRVFRDWQAQQEVDPAQVDWHALGASNLPYTFRQDPGPLNALGRIKFLFHNRHNIYLHDTPHEGLFSYNERAYSSGCIRLEEPLRLADFVLSTERSWQWDQALLQAVIDSGKTLDIPLAERLPVYLLYLTAWVGEDGAVNFRPDIYGEDTLLAPGLPGAEPLR